MPKHQLSPNEVQALRFIRNSLIHSKSPSIRDIQKDLGYSSPRSAALIVEKLIKAGCVKRKNDGRLRLLRDLAETNSYARTVLVPLVGTAACGIPLLADENIETMIPVSTELAKPGHLYFLLRAKGDSMDQAGIADGNLVLVRQQSTADSGRVVVALIDDEATIKEFHRSQNTVVLKPRSSSNRHRPIILTKEFQIQGVVLTTISGLD
jgi:repressor LexA